MQGCGDCIKIKSDFNNEIRKESKMKRKIILIIAICVFLFSAYQLFTIYREYHKGTEEYKEVEDSIITKVEGKKDETDSESGEEGTTGDRFRVDFEKLLKMNEETIAWIRFDKPEKINYPVVHTSDNSTYLTKTLNGQNNSSGALFVDMNNEGDFTDKNTFIYGHNMKNDSMFGKLEEYKSSKFCKKNPYFYIYTPDGKIRTYQVFATAIVENNADNYQIYFNDNEDFEAYIKMVRESALYATDVSVTGSDQLVSLSTCTNVTQSQRMIVHGVLVKVEESE